jgi:hypothetical protein
LTDILRQRVHVSVAIEGNTNSSFLAELGNVYGPERVLIYRLVDKRFMRLSDLPYNPTQSLLKMGKELLGNTPFFNNSSDNNPGQKNGERLYTRRELPRDTAAVHGFYTPGMFKGIYENPFISIILKDPLERMITLYNEWASSKGEVKWRFSPPYKNKLSFIDFVLQEGFFNFQTKCLGSKRLGDFDLVGIAECQDGFIAQLKNKDWTGYVDSSSREINFDKPRFRNLGITPEFLDHFRDVNQLDYAIYELAKEFMGYC